MLHVVVGVANVPPEPRHPTNTVRFQDILCINKLNVLNDFDSNPRSVSSRGVYNESEERCTATTLTELN